MRQPSFVYSYGSVCCYPTRTFSEAMQPPDKFALVSASRDKGELPVSCTMPTGSRFAFESFQPNPDGSSTLVQRWEAWQLTATPEGKLWSYRDIAFDQLAAWVADGARHA